MTLQPIPNTERTDCSIYLCPAPAVKRVVIAYGHGKQMRVPFCAGCLSLYQAALRTALAAERAVAK